MFDYFATLSIPAILFLLGGCFLVFAILLDLFDLDIGDFVSISFISMFLGIFCLSGSLFALRWPGVIPAVLGGFGCSLLIAVPLRMALRMFKNNEANSVRTIATCVGLVGVVTIAIGRQGAGEVLIESDKYLALSYQRDIPAGTKVKCIAYSQSALYVEPVSDN